MQVGNGGHGYQILEIAFWMIMIPRGRHRAATETVWNRESRRQERRREERGGGGRRRDQVGKEGERGRGKKNQFAINAVYKEDAQTPLGDCKTRGP